MGNRTIKHIVILVYCLFTISIGLGLSEFVFINFKILTSRDIYLMGFAAQPYTVIDNVKINSMGFTGDVINKQKALNTVRILTLGGSAMFNRNMSLRLKSELQKKTNKKIELLGAALRTHTTASSILKYKLLSKYEFDYVLIYHAINDLWANDVDVVDFKNDYSHLDPWYKRNLCLEKLIICRNIYNKWIYRKPPQKFYNDISGLPGEVIFEKNILKLINMIRDNDGNPILMTFAWSIPNNYTEKAFNNNMVGYNNPDNYNKCPVELWGPVNYVKDGLNRYNSIIKSLANNHKVLIIDQERLIGKNLSYFGDVCHLSEDGTEKFIKNITDYFIQMELL